MGFFMDFFFKKKLIASHGMHPSVRLSPHGISKNRKEKNGWVNGVYKNVIVSPPHCHFPPPPLHHHKAYVKRRKGC